MSFWTALKKFGAVAANVEHVAAPIASVLFPQFAPVIGQLDGWVARIHTNILTLEQNNPVDGQGKLKSDAVIADFNAGLDITQTYLATKGKMLTYDKDKLQSAIAHFAQGYNDLAEVKKSFKEVDLPK